MLWKGWITGKVKKHHWGFEENALCTKMMFYINSKCKIWECNSSDSLNLSSADGLVAAALVRALKANTDQVRLNSPDFPKAADSECLCTHTNKIPKTSMWELKLKDPLVMSSAPRKRFISNNIKKKIFTGDKVLVKKLQLFTPGLPQGNNINYFFPSDDKLFLNKYVHVLCQLRGTAL